MEDLATEVVEDCPASVQYTPSQDNAFNGIQPVRLFETPKVRPSIQVLDRVPSQ
jgi:hypothetical protein